MIEETDYQIPTSWDVGRLSKFLLHMQHEATAELIGDELATMFKWERESYVLGKKTGLIDLCIVNHGGPGTASSVALIEEAAEEIARQRWVSTVRYVSKLGEGTTHIYFYLDEEHAHD